MRVNEGLLLTRFLEVTEGASVRVLKDSHLWQPASNYPEGLAPGKRVFNLEGTDIVWVGGHLIGEAFQRMTFFEEAGNLINFFGQHISEVDINPFLYPLPDNYKEISEIEYNAKYKIEDTTAEARFNESMQAANAIFKESKDKKYEILKSKGFTKKEIEILLS